MPGFALVSPGLGPVSPETSSESAWFGLVWARFRLRRPRNFLGFALVWPGLGPVSPETSSQFDIPPRDPPPPSLLLLILSHSHYLFIRPHFFSSGHSMSCPLQRAPRVSPAHSVSPTPPHSSAIRENADVPGQKPTSSMQQGEVSSESAGPRPEPVCEDVPREIVTLRWLQI